MLRDSCTEALRNFSNATFDLLITWETNMPSSDNDYSEATNDLMCTGYPFDEDFQEVAQKIFDWKWSVIQKAEGR